MDLQVLVRFASVGWLTLVIWAGGAILLQLEVLAKLKATLFQHRKIRAATMLLTLSFTTMLIRSITLAPLPAWRLEVDPFPYPLTLYLLMGAILVPLWAGAAFTYIIWKTNRKNEANNTTTAADDQSRSRTRYP